jgi:hypothetical protein
MHSISAAHISATSRPPPLRRDGALAGRALHHLLPAVGDHPRIEIGDHPRAGLDEQKRQHRVNQNRQPPP